MIYLIEHHGTPIYITEDGHFVAAVNGTEHRATRLEDVKRKIIGRPVEPIRFMTAWDVETPRFSRARNIAGTYGASKEKVYDDLGSVWKLGEIYHANDEIMQRARAINTEIARLYAERKALANELRPITADDLKAVTP